MATRTLSAVREACALPPESRTEEHVDDILNFVKDVKFFTKLTPPQQRALCRALSLETFGAREYIFQNGEYGTKFYIILTGSVGVQCPSSTAPCPSGVHAPGQCDCLDRPLETLVFLDKGLGFGELALQSNAPRSASILTSEVTEVLVITKEDYDCHAGQRHKAFLDQRVDFLRSCPGVERALEQKLFTNQDVIQMANCLNEQSLWGNCLVCKQGEAADRVIFVRSGSLAVLRTMELDAVKTQDGPTMPSYSGRKSLTPAAATAAAAAGGSKNNAKIMLEMKKSERLKRRSEIAHEQLRIDEQKKKEAEEKAKRDEEAQQGTRESFDGEDNVMAMLPSTGSGKGPKQLWGKVKMAAKLWAGTNAIIKDAEKKKAEKEMQAANAEAFDSVAAAQESIEHFKDVQAARKLVSSFEEKRLREKTAKYKDALRQRSSNMMKKDADWKTMMRKLTVDRFQRQNTRVSGVDSKDGGKFSSMARRGKPVELRKSIVNVGSIGPFQYYGDQQVLMNSSYPFSLLTDPVAEVYIMSKNDIMRRLPKKIIMSFFCSDEGDFPKDERIVEMVRQTERWEAFCHDAWADAYGAKKIAFTVNGIPRSIRDSAVSKLGCNVSANREFVGLNKPEHLDDVDEPEDDELNIDRILGSHCRQTALTHKDSEYFSGSSAKFLSRMGNLESDKGLSWALTKDGTREAIFRKHELEYDYTKERDPHTFRTEKFWSKLQKDPLKELFEEEFSLEAIDEAFAANIEARAQPNAFASSFTGVSGTLSSQQLTQHKQQSQGKLSNTISPTITEQKPSREPSNSHRQTNTLDTFGHRVVSSRPAKGRSGADMSSPALTEASATGSGSPKGVSVRFQAGQSPVQLASLN